MSKDAPKLDVIEQEIEKKSRELMELMLERERARGKDRPVTFLEIEIAAGEMGRQIGRGIISEAVAEQMASMIAEIEVVQCPECDKSCQRKVEKDGKPMTKDMVLQSPEGPVPIREPVFHCSTCRRDFFPSAERTASEWS